MTIKHCTNDIIQDGTFNYDNNYFRYKQNSPSFQLSWRLTCFATLHKYFMRGFSANSAQHSHFHQLKIES